MLYQLSYAKLAPHGGVRTRDRLGDNDETDLYATAVKHRGTGGRDFCLMLYQLSYATLSHHGGTRTRDIQIPKYSRPTPPAPRHRSGEGVLIPINVA